MNTNEARKAFLEATHHLATAGDILTKIASLLVNPESSPVEDQKIDPQDFLNQYRSAQHRVDDETAQYPEAVQDAIREFLSRGEVDSRQLHEILYGVYIAGCRVSEVINQAQDANVNGAGSILGAERQQADVNYASPTPAPVYRSTKTTDYTFDDQGRITRMVEVSES